jgi:DNA (cytosine-5)-methyltransferase 1
MKYLSLFSGIEAASAAWIPLGWECVGFAEIEKFPCAVLKHHYPTVPNLGDITKITQKQVEALGCVDVVIGGFPCQDLSVAGKRKGLKNADGTATRSGLFYDAMRIFWWSKARYLLIENVPGLFSSNGGKDFASVVGEMAGCECSPPRDGWENSGCAVGKRGMLEWCCLDAQYFGLAQRRVRCFLVLDTGNWFNRPPILLVESSLQGYPAPSREKGQGVAADVAPSLTGSGRGVERTGESIGQDPVIAHSLRAEGFDASEDGTGRGTPMVPVISPAIKSRDSKGPSSDGDGDCACLVPICFKGGQSAKARSLGLAENISPTLPSSDSGSNRAPVVAIRTAQTSANGCGISEGVAHTLDQSQGQAVVYDMRGNGDGQTVNTLSGDHASRPTDYTPVVTYPIDMRNAGRDPEKHDEINRQGIGVGDEGEPAHTVSCAHVNAVAFAQNQRGELRDACTTSKARDIGAAPDEQVGMRGCAMEVRRLLPSECEFLMGLPRNYTRIPWRGKSAADCPDGPRYKALGNSMAVPVIRWIGERIQMMENERNH